MDIWTDRLSEYLDDELSDTERLDLDRHLIGCEICRRTLAELRAVTDVARTAEDARPSRNLWPGIATAIARQSAPRRVVFSIPQLVAAGVFVALMSGLSVWVWMARDAPPALRTSAARPAAELVRTSTVDATYDRAISDLVRTLDEGREHLGPRTVAVLERSLRTIDRAINDASAALDQDPGNAYLSLHL